MIYGGVLYLIGSAIRSSLLSTSVEFANPPTLIIYPIFNYPLNIGK